MRSIRPGAVRCALGTGGGRRDRTDDPLLAKQVLSQLSYAPFPDLLQGTCPRPTKLVGLVGFEPTTPALSRRCSNRLSYRPLSLSSSTADKREHLTLKRKLWKGGDPAAPSDTATLLRLHPSHEPHRGKRPPCG